MRSALKTLALTGLLLVLLDLLVALALRAGAPDALVRFFEHGRSVPGKIALWQADPNSWGNLYDVAWRPEALRLSAEMFTAEPAGLGPVVRTYGMSFVNNITDAAQRIRPDLIVDAHAGPGAPPNFTYALFLDDRANRRPGDIVVLGILSQVIPAMNSFSNRVWSFEQPAPVTYPIFLPDAVGGLQRIDPLVQSRADQDRLGTDQKLAEAWMTQLRSQDRLYTAAAFAFPELDLSPLARLIRRAVATGAIAKAEAGVLDGDYPYPEVLRRMVRDFAATARADGQFPVVMLIQGRNPGDPDLAALLRQDIETLGIPALITADIVDAKEPKNYVGDGHMTKAADARLGERLLEILAAGSDATTDGQ